jgi:6-phosphogluconolactonase
MQDSMARHEPDPATGGDAVKLEVLGDAEALARYAAEFVAAEACAAAETRGRFAFASSGGDTAGRMLRALAGQKLPWRAVHVFQVDERVAPAGHPDRNLKQLAESLLAHTELPPGHLHAMPVEERNLTAAVARYAQELEAVCGSPPVLDLVHLGLGSDGHTASLVPGDPVLEVVERDVAVSGVYRAHRRMTLTYPALARARRIFWLVTGSEKAPMLARLRAGDRSIPAGRVCRDRASILADRAAAGVHPEEGS